MKWVLLCSSLLLLTSFTSAQSPSHEEEVVRATYGTVSFLCGMEPLTKAAVRQMRTEISQTRTDQEISSATPVFEVSNVQTGSIASIGNLNWSTRFSIPQQGNNVILDGTMAEDSYADATTPQVAWTEARVRWDTDDSYTPDVVTALHSLTVAQAIKKDGPFWTVPATYTSYATFQVMVSFQDRTIGPYTASFFFGKDAAGKEVVAPQDAFGAGQLLWAVLKRNVYPSKLLTSKLREQSVIAQWVSANTQQYCSSTRSDLCCSHGRCALPDAPVKRDLATPISHSN